MLLSLINKYFSPNGIIYLFSLQGIIVTIILIGYSYYQL